MKLARFMGNPYAHEYTSAGAPINPDTSYALNLDNMIKILAILTRFRYFSVRIDVKWPSHNSISDTSV